MVYWFGFLQSQTPVKQSDCESLTGRNSQKELLESVRKANQKCVIEWAAHCQSSLKSLTDVWKTSQNYLN